MSRVELMVELRAAFVGPTVKQREAYGRFAHTLAAACLIGAVTIIFAEDGTSSSTTARVTGLIIAGVTCFLTGALLSKGE